MTETTINAQQAVPPEPELVRDVHEPKGVLRKNLKPFIYLGAALLVILAAVFSGTSKKTPSQQAAARHEPPQPTVQDNTDNNVQDLKNQLAAEQQRQAQQAGATGDPALATATPAQQAAAARYSSTGQTVPCVPGQPCAQPNIYGQQSRPALDLPSGARGSTTGSQGARTGIQLAICIESRIYPPAGGSGFATDSGRSGGSDCGWLFTRSESKRGASTQTGSSLVAARPAGDPHTSSRASVDQTWSRSEHRLCGRPALRHL